MGWMLVTFGKKIWKKLHYLTGQLLKIVLCRLISQHVNFYKARWILTSNPLFGFPLVHEVIAHAHGFCSILHGFWLRIVFNYSKFSPRSKDGHKI